MKAELEEALYRDFPEPFSDRELGIQKSCMAWGCSCGDGWEPILRRMMEKLKDKPFKLDQVKEKFGTLRVYWHSLKGCSKEDWDLIGKITDEAERESETTCEFCGASGAKLREGGWLRTLCDKCHAPEAREKNRQLQLEQLKLKQLRREGKLVDGFGDPLPPEEN